MLERCQLSSWLMCLPRQASTFKRGHECVPEPRWQDATGMGPKRLYCRLRRLANLHIHVGLYVWISYHVVCSVVFVVPESLMNTRKNTNDIIYIEAVMMKAHGTQQIVK